MDLVQYFGNHYWHQPDRKIYANVVWKRVKVWYAI